MANSGNPIPQAENEANTLRFRDDPVPDDSSVDHSGERFADDPTDELAGELVDEEV